MASRLPSRLADHARYFSHNAAVRVAAGASPALPAAPTSRTRSLFASSALLATGVLSGIALVLLAPRPKSIALIFPVPTAVAPGAETAEGRKWTADIEQGLQELKVVKELRGKMEKVDGQEGEVRSWTESRPYATSVPGPHSLSASTLRGPGKFAIPPLVFTNVAQTEGIFVLHLGTSLCGHEGIIHGGLLATILDEALARTAFLGLPGGIGVTATLGLKYRKPTWAGAYVVLRTKLVKVQGRKAWVQGHVEDLEGTVLVDAEALFVEPKMAKFLDKSSVREAMG